MTMLAGVDMVIYIHRISYGRVGVIVNVRTIWKSYFFTDELKNCDNTLRYWFYSKDCELATEIKQRLCVYLRAVTWVARYARYG